MRSPSSVTVIRCVLRRNSFSPSCDSRRLTLRVTVDLGMSRRTAAFDRLPLSTTFANTTRSEEHTSELQSLMRISYAVFCLKKKNKHTTIPITAQSQKYEYKRHKIVV